MKKKSLLAAPALVVHHEIHAAIGDVCRHGTHRA